MKARAEAGAAGVMLRLNERTRRVRLLLVFLLLASLALVTIDFRSRGDGLLEKLGSGVSAILGPLQDGLAKITRPVGDFFAGFGRAGSLRSEIRGLERNLAELQQDRARLLDLAEENARLREALGLRVRLALKTKAAEVIAVDSSNFEQAVVISLGTRDGVRKDMPVVVGEGLVGRVAEAGPGTSKVLLIVDPRSRVSVKLAGSGEVGSLEGRGRAEMRLELLDANVPITAGVQVVTYGTGSLFPSGIPIGTVSSVEAPGGRVTRIASVKPAVDFTSLDVVLVVVGTGPRPRPSPSPTATASASPSPSPGATR
ncbi:MAG: rod shape-determining protein MreC [Actinomycetota bacterium]